jgi:hypothetical protein
LAISFLQYASFVLILSHGTTVSIFFLLTTTCYRLGCFPPSVWIASVCYVSFLLQTFSSWPATRIVLMSYRVFRRLLRRVAGPGLTSSPVLSNSTDFRLVIRAVLWIVLLENSVQTFPLDAPLWTKSVAPFFVLPYVPCLLKRDSHSLDGSSCSSLVCCCGTRQDGRWSDVKNLL